ncbi:permease [Thermobifida halotolerans]|uniref:Permease n=1 Tax=Thermobifida halotolerans TaxID=483545 RepID=A0A399G340_9ACTN|nr:permease [Thermobifida halotolerans]UOE22021.1 permease [Thermobifida halotolerans]
MLAGHFGVSGMVKAWRPELPMGVLLVASQAPDILFLSLAAAGVESLEPVAGRSGYGSLLIHAPYSHALLSAVLLSAVLGLLVHLWARGRWGPDSGWVVGGVVFSHWLLDLLVHRPDIAVLTGGAGGLPYLGLGLWEFPLLAALVEGALVVAGTVLYAWRTLRDHPRRTRAVLYSVGVALLLVGSFVWDLLG